MVEKHTQKGMEVAGRKCSHFALVFDKQVAQIARKQLEKQLLWDDTRRLAKVTEQYIAIPINYRCVQALLATVETGHISFLHESDTSVDLDKRRKKGADQSVLNHESLGVLEESSSARGLKSNDDSMLETSSPCRTSENVHSTSLSLPTEAQVAKNGARSHSKSLTDSPYHSSTENQALTSLSSFQGACLLENGLKSHKRNSSDCSHQGTTHENALDTSLASPSMNVATSLVTAGGEEQIQMAVPDSSNLLLTEEEQAGSLTSRDKNHTMKNGNKTLTLSIGTDTNQNSHQRKDQSPSFSTADGLKDILWSGKLFNLEGKLVKIHLPASKKAKLITPYDRLHALVGGWVKEGRIEWKEDLGKEIPKNWERHGDMVLLPSACFLDPVWTNVTEVWPNVASALNCSRLARRGRIQSDDFRSPRTELLYGTDPYVEHQDNGIKYTFDVRYSMFSSGNITEKMRVAALDCSNETVVDLYAGIGYFTLPYLVHARAKLLYACEWNPHAVLALCKNLKLNHVNERCIVLEGDNRKVCPRGVADRVNLGLIPSSEEGWAVACAALKPVTGGTLHIHGNVDSYPHREWSEPRDAADSTHVQDFSRQRVYKSAATPSRNVLSLHQLRMTDPQRVHRSDTPPEDIAQSCSDDATGNSPSGESSLDTMSEVTFNAIHQSNLFDKKLYESSSAFKRKKWVEWGCHAMKKVNDLLCSYHGNYWSVEIMHIEHVKSYAPHIDHLVVDLKCRPLV